MKIKPNYLYRVLGDLEKEGRVKKHGRQYSSPGRAQSEPSRPAGSKSAPSWLAFRAPYLKLHHARVDPLARKVRHLEALDDRPLAAAAGAGNAADDSLADSV